MRITRKPARLRFGRCLGLAALVSAAVVAPAQAATHTVGVLPLTARGNPVAGEQPALQVSVPLPRGQAEADDGFIVWREPRRRCAGHMTMTFAAAPNAIHVGPRLHRSPTTVLLHTATGDRRVPATVFDGRGRSDFYEWVAMVRFRLPADLIPAYGRRTVYVLAAPFPAHGNCARRDARRLARIARAGVLATVVTVPADYTLPPPPNPPRPIDLKARPAC